jgi:twitching motility protein PilT
MAEIDHWLRNMLELKGSDLHLRAGAPPMWRIHGHLGPIPEEPVIDQERMARLMHEIIPAERWQRFQKTFDHDWAYAIGDEARFRVNYFQHNHGYGCVLRHIPAKVLTLQDLEAPEVLSELPHFRDGLVLVTGPTGSGKSTTLAAIIDEINRHYHKHVITIEDPIEFVHQNLGCIITQREVGCDTPEFAQALKDALREDPDVILVGEMRDLETISLAITLAETGVLIFATLHTNSAAKTIDRIIDVFPPGRQQQVRIMLSTSLRAIVAQQLLRRAHVKGRIAAHEILISSTAVANIIREGRTEKILSYIQSGRDRGMVTMDHTLQDYLDRDLISGEEAYMFAQDKSLFQEYFHHDIKPDGKPAAAKPAATPAKPAATPAKPAAAKPAATPAKPAAAAAPAAKPPTPGPAKPAAPAASKPQVHPTRNDK